MKRLWILVVIFFVIYWAVSLSSCQHEDDYKYFLIKVDSVFVPEPVISNNAFEMEFFGYIGYNGCYGFSEFVLEKQNNFLLSAQV